MSNHPEELGEPEDSFTSDAAESEDESVSDDEVNAVSAAVEPPTVNSDTYLRGYCDEDDDPWEVTVDADGRKRFRRKKTMTEKQVAVNRANAKKSSGPRTPAGKEASSRNAAVHGGYVGMIYSADAGRFREDPDAVANNYLAVRGSFQPKDALESALAERVASDVISLGRLDRYEMHLIDSVSQHSAVQYTPGADPYILHMARNVVTVLDVPDFEIEATWKEMAIFVRSQCWRQDAFPTITDLWTREIEPSTPEDWKRAFHLLINAAFKEGVAAAVERFGAVVRHHWSATGRLDSQEKYEKVDQLVAALSRLQAVRSLRTRDLVSTLSAIRISRTPIKGVDET